MYCTFVLFVNQHFLGLPASGTHCIIPSTKKIYFRVYFILYQLLAAENKLFGTSLSGGIRGNVQSASLKSAGNAPSNMAFITDSLTKL
jgi:hypothetical protein